MIVVADTSGLVAALDEDHPAQRRAQQALQTAGTVVISPVVLGEVDHVARRVLGARAAITLIDDISRWARVGRVVLPAVTADVTALPFRPGTFDVVVAAFVINHLEDPVAGLAEFRRVARRGGVVLASTFSEERAVAKEAVDVVAASYGFVAPDWYNDLQECAQAARDVAGLERSLAEAGFEGTRLTVVKAAPVTERLEQVLQAAPLLQQFPGIVAVAPLPMTLNPLRPTTGYDDVKLVALVRVALPEVPHVQVDWLRYGPKLAQVALTFGADDVDNVSASDDGPEGRRRAPVEELKKNIESAGFAAVERDGRFVFLS